MEQRESIELPNGVEVLYEVNPRLNLERSLEGQEEPSYRNVLRQCRESCPQGTHVMRLYDYLELWKQHFREVVIPCYSGRDISKETFTPQTPHIFRLPTLVDTYLTGWEMEGMNYESLTAEVVDGGENKGRIYVPPLGKIYKVNKFGIPSRTGKGKTDSSELFIHSWWAFSMPEIINPIGGEVIRDFDMAIFANGGTMGCFYEFLKAHYSLDDREGFYQVLSFPDKRLSRGGLKNDGLK